METSSLLLTGTKRPLNGKKRGLDGYGPQPKKRPVFKMSPNCGSLKVKPWHKFGELEEHRLAENGLTLLRDENGLPVCRRRADLKPGEVSLVLR